jgi:hypothetical protein
LLSDYCTATGDKSIIPKKLEPYCDESKAMKKIFLFVFVAIVSQNCLIASEEPTRPKAGKLPLNVAIDPRVELMSVIFRLAGKEYNQCRVDSYAKDVEKHFGKFREHPAVVIARKVCKERGVSYDACMSMAVHISDAEKCDERMPFDPWPENLDRRWTVDGTREFLAATRQFVKDTHFNDFMADHRSLYETTQTRMNDLLEKNAHLEWFDEFFGDRPQASFTIILGMLNGPSNYGARFRSADGKEDLYCIFGIWETDKEGLPKFNRSMMGTIVHEFCHSYVNPLGSQYATQIAKYAKLYDPIADTMRSQAYPLWAICVNEHIVRACTTRYSYAKEGKEQGDLALQGEKKCGFFYDPALCERLKDYEQNRDKYKTFAEFYPELVKVFEELSNQNLGEDFYSIRYDGKINAVGQDKKSVILIVPTNENNPETQKGINDFVRQYLSFYPKSPIITDAEALKKDLSKNSLILFGTMNGNLWLKENASKFPFKIEKDRIAADKDYVGTDLRFISAWPHPQNPKLGILIYTAQQAKDVININSVFHGPTDYVIASGNKIIKAGNYKKDNNAWSF